MSLSSRIVTVRGRLRRLALVPLAAIGLAAGLVGFVAPQEAQAATLVGYDLSWPQCPSRLPPTSTRFVVIGLTNGRPFTRNPCVARQASWAAAHGVPTHAYAMAAFPTTAQLTAYGGSGPWSSATRAGRLSNVGYAEAAQAAATIRSVPGWAPRMVWIDVEPRTVQPWPSTTTAQRRENRYVLEGLMRGLRATAHSYGLYSNSSGWRAITGSWYLPGVPVWATAGPVSAAVAAAKCTSPSFSGGRVYLAQWWDATWDHDRTCGTYAFGTLPMPPPPPSGSAGDVTGDWNADVVARWGSGSLRLYAGSGHGSIAASTEIGRGWDGFTAVARVGDANRDGTVDVAARSADGRLWLYRGTGHGGWVLPPLLVGTGWNVFDLVVGAGDLTGDQRFDVVARRPDGSLWLYAGSASGTGFATWRPGVLLGRGWNAMAALVGVGDVTGDGRADLLARERATGYLWIYPGTGTGGFAARVRTATGWGGMTAVSGPGDLTGDRVPDVVARDAAGRLWLYPRLAAGGWGTRVVLGTGWNVVSTIL